ncbi:alpha-2-macroglobulin family protein [Ferruginibacter sp.]
MSTKRYVILSLAILFSLNIHAQTELNAKTWFEIDSSLARKSNLTTLRLRVTGLYLQALLNNQYLHAARCLNYRLRIDDLKNEDSLYFKNSAFIDSLLQQPQHPQMQYALHLMQAARLKNFITRYNRFQQNTYYRKDIPVNYASYKNISLDSMVQLHFETAKTIAKTISSYKVADALWLSSDALQFLYQPGLYDIAITEQLASVKWKYYYQLPYGTRAAKWMGLSADDFITKLDTLNSQQEWPLRDIKLYKEWLSYYQNNRPNYYFVETILRKYLYELVRLQNKEAEPLYESYLQQLTNSRYNIVKAYSVYQLCLLWNSQAARYFPASNRPVYNYQTASYTTEGFDTTYRYHPVKALQLFNANRQVMDSFVYLKNILTGMEEKIKNPDITLTLQQHNLPGETFLAELKFKNTDTFYYRIVRPSGRYPSFGTYPTKNQWTDVLLKMPLVKDSFIILPRQDDRNYHNVYIPMDAMLPGNYCIILSPRQLQDSSVWRSNLYFNITNIAVVNNEQQVYVLHRKTGKPLSGAAVTAIYNESVWKNGASTYIRHEEKYTVNDKGFFKVKDANYKDLTVVYGNDTLVENVQYHSNGSDDDDDVYSKDEYDDLVDFYMTNAVAYIYTDRSIYRPGQTVFYKAIFITKDKNTGEPLVMNKENLKGKLLGSVFKKLLKEEEPLLYIKDAFDKEMDSVKISPDEYGAVSGSFKIPKTAATGEWNIEPDYIDVEMNTGSFKVEEYKRPSYEVQVEKPQKELKMGDSIVFKVKLRSFAGAALNNVKINYTVTRAADFFEYDSAAAAITSQPSHETIIDTTGFTGSNGELQIVVYDTAVLRKSISPKDSWRMGYDVDVEAVDATGESYDKSADITVRAKPILIKIPLNNSYERSNLAALLVSTIDDNAGEVGKKVSVKVYRVTKETKLFNNRDFTGADTWLYDKNNLQQQFPYDNLLKEEPQEKKELVYEKSINTAAKEKLLLDKDLLTAGDYTIEANCTENGKITGEWKRGFLVFDAQNNKLPGTGWSFTQLPNNAPAAGEKVKYYFGNSWSEAYTVFQLLYYSGGKKKTIRSVYEEQLYAKGLQQYNLQLPANITGEVKLTQMYILNNQLFTHTETMYIPEPPKDQPEIIIEKYRKQLTPGSKETFTVSIKTKNVNTAAQLMTTMYDASLDKLEKHKWDFPNKKDDRGGYIYADWTSSINNESYSYNVPYFPQLSYSPKAKKGRTAPLWWINPLDYSEEDVMGDWNAGNTRNNTQYFARSFSANFGPDNNYIYNWSNNSNDDGVEDVLKKLPGLSLATTQGLDQVVVVGYGTSKRSEYTGAMSSVRIRGFSTAGLLANSQPLIIVDGVIYEGDLSKLDPKTLTDGLILKGADGSAVYGARGATGVLVLSTKGPVILPKEPEPVIVPRKNFNETAFFFPAIYADKKGYYSFNFTMPESVTEWNWKLLAHTKNAVFAYAERKLNTQLPLMVQPNMPRLLYQGDKMVLQSRISNLDSSNASGKIQCKIEDAVTGEDITAKLLAATQNNFTVAAKANTAAAFVLTVPSTQVNPLKISITVRTQNFADGEEHTIPVLSPKVFVRDNTAFYFKQHKDTSLQLAALPADAAMYGIGVSMPSRPQAALLYSLPELANYPYDCAEQTMNKLFAYTTAYKLMRTDKDTRTSYDSAKQYVEKQNAIIEKLPDELNQEAMPWLNLGNQTAQQQKKLFNLLDTAHAGAMIITLMDRLQKLQNADGGITWFENGKSNDYISSYVLKGMGKLYAEKQNFPAEVFNNTAVPFLNKLSGYCDAAFAASLKENNPWYNGLYYAYSRSYTLAQYPLKDSLQQRVHNMLLSQWNKQSNARHLNLSLYNRALLIIASIKFANNQQDSLYSNAVAQLQSIEQLAIEDEQNGLRWKELADDDDLTNSAEETIALLAEAFALDNNSKVNKGIIKWLLTAKNEHSWSSTKATAAVINVLANENKTVSGPTQTIKATTGTAALSVSDDLLQGSTFGYAATATNITSVQLKKENEAAISGNLYRYYFTAANNLSYLNHQVELTKQWYKLSSTGAWEPITTGSSLKIADKIKVVISIQSAKPLRYVFINDKRAAALEPIDNSSGYDYNDGIGFYRSVRDAGTQFFIDLIPSGKHQIEYEMKVAHEGVFTNGIAQLQCMYRPDITAYSNGMQLTTTQ